MQQVRRHAYQGGYQENNVLRHAYNAAHNCGALGMLICEVHEAIELQGLQLALLPPRTVSLLSTSTS